MQTSGMWLFAAADGTIVMPILLAVMAWRSPPGLRMRRLLLVTGTWLAVCVLAGVVRLATNDAYYSPRQVTYWAHSTSGERRIAAGLLLATGLAAAVTFGMARRRSGTGGGLAVIGGALLTTLVMLGDSVALGLH
jgi:hypothetical protein